MLTTQNPAQHGDLAVTIARHLEGASFDDLDADTTEVTKLSVLDTVGVILAASDLVPGVEDYVAVALDMGGRPESTVFGFGDRLPAPLAAWANGAMAHGLDFDDLVRDLGYHPSSTTVPSAIATAERVGGVRGADLVLAIALGADLGVRLASSIDEWRGWFTTPVLGTLASAAASSKILGLDARAIHDAIGIAYTQAAGTLEMRWSTDSDIASFYASWPNKAGIMSSLLASRGIRGVGNVFEGRAGLYATYFDTACQRDTITDGLGVRFRNAEVSFKPWPTCGGAQPAIDATLKLFSTHDVRPDDVERVTVATTGGTFTLCEPIEARRAPTTPMDAKFSIPYVIALAAVRGHVTLDDFRAERLKERDVLDFAQRITAIDDPSLAIRKAAMPARIEVTTVDGRTFTERSDQPRGTWPYSRLSADEVIDKFRDCAAHARRPLPASSIGQFIEGVMDLEHVDDVTSLTKLLSPA